MESSGPSVTSPVSAANLFHYCINEIDSIQMGLTYDHPHEVSMTKLFLLRRRLADWGASVSVTKANHKSSMLMSKWNELREPVTSNLGGIYRLFQSDQFLQSRYGLRRASMDSPNARMSTSLLRLEMILKREESQLQSQALARQDMKWQIYDKQKFDSLLATIAQHVTSLEELGRRLDTMGMKDRRMRQITSSIVDLDSRGLLNEAMETSDSEEDNSEPTLSDNHQQQSPNTHGHQYSFTYVIDHSKGVVGNVGEMTKLSGHHQYKETHTEIHSRIVVGNTESNFAATFLNDPVTH